MAIVSFWSQKAALRMEGGSSKLVAGRVGYAGVCGGTVTIICSGVALALIRVGLFYRSTLRMVMIATVAHPQRLVIQKTGEVKNPIS